MNLLSGVVETLSKFLNGKSWRAYAIARPLAFLLRLAGPRRRIAEINLAIALPDSTSEERKAYLRETYDHMVWVGVEALKLCNDPRRVLEWMTCVKGAEILRAAYEAGKGAILLTGHAGNWEILASWVAQSGYPVTAIVRHSTDSAERDVIDAMRNRLGVKTLSKDAPMTRAISIIKRGEFLGILPDQHGGGANGALLDFFGVNTFTSTGAAVFAYLTGAPLIPVGSRRIEPFKHEVYVLDPLEWTKKENRDATVLDITQKINRVMETFVRRAPGQWLAEHKRFKEIY